MAMVLSGAAPAATPQEPDCDSPVRPATIQADLAKPEQRASEFIAALKAKLDARNNTGAAQNHAEDKNMLSANSLSGQQ